MNNQTTDNMTSTATLLPQNVQEKINDLVAENYHLDDIQEFINEHGNDNFLNYYELYVELGEQYVYDAVDAFIAEFGIQDLESFTEAYYGVYDSPEEFAEQFVTDCYPINLDDTPIVVDWTATWESNLRYDFAFNNNCIFNKNF